MKENLLKLFEGRNFTTVLNGYVEVEVDDPNLLDEIVENAFEYGLDILYEAIKETIQTEVDVNLILPDKYMKRIGELNADDVGKLVKIRGLICRMGNIRARCEGAMFLCRKCRGEVGPVPQTIPFLLIKPFKCPNSSSSSGKRKCGGMSFDFIPEVSTWISTQELMIQELPNDIKGQVPALMKLMVLKDSLIKKANCGDKVEIVGIVRATSPVTKSRFADLYVEIDNIIRKKKDIEATVLSDEEIEQIKALSQDPDIYLKLINSIAPSLHGLTVEKESCLLSMFGGVRRKLTDGYRRGSIHVLLVGDPSTGKSRLLLAVQSVTPSGMYSQGKGTTAAGLTAAVLRQGQSGENWIISAGVMVLADKGIACIDEIDKMSNEDRVAIHEAMEQQTVTIDKANIHASLPANTTVIAAANPSFGRYIIQKSIHENIKNLPVTLLSRFDLILILRDIPEEERDAAMTEHILQAESAKGFIERDLMKKYIIYAKRIEPEMGKEAGLYLKKKFSELRKRQKEDDPIPITARQFESLIRLSEAHARTLLKTKVDVKDAEAAVQILTESLRQTCFDAETGKQDIDSVESGRRKSVSDKMQLIYTLIRSGFGEMAFGDVIIAEAEKKYGMDEFEVRKIITKLLNEGMIINPQDGYYKAV